MERHKQIELIDEALDRIEWYKRYMLIKSRWGKRKTNPNTISIFTFSKSKSQKLGICEIMSELGLTLESSQELVNEITQTLYDEELRPGLYYADWRASKFCESAVSWYGLRIEALLEYRALLMGDQFLYDYMY